MTHARDRIRISGMRFWGKHGAAPGERERQQPIDVDVELHIDCEPAAKSDDLNDTVDYDRIFHHCEAIVTQRSFTLLEALAAACLSEATIRVRKPRLLDGATPEVELTRSR